MPKIDDSVVTMLLRVLGHSKLPEIKEMVKTMPAKEFAAAIIEKTEWMQGAGDPRLVMCPKCCALAPSADVLVVWKETLTPLGGCRMVSCLACKFFGTEEEE